MKTSFSLNSFALTAVCLLWLLCVTVGLCQVERYNNRPGQAASAPRVWPGDTPLSHGRDGMTLIMAVHPQCPCTRASLAELAQLMARAQGRLRATAVFLRYPGVPAGWVQTDTWRQAEAIPGVHVVSDADGTIARRFGALTSGQTYLYDGQGRLLFSGGLTGERGHEGDNAGLQAALALLRGQTPAQTRAPVFGCPLFPHPLVAKKEFSGRS